MVSPETRKRNKCELGDARKDSLFPAERRTLLASPADDHRRRCLRELRRAPACKCTERAMRSFKGPTHAFDTADLAALDQVVDSIWTVVQAQDPFRGFGKDREIQEALRKKIFALASSGMRDPELLRNLVLATLPSPTCEST
jgi:hypothetical protein